MPFKGAADAITALLGGHIDVAFGVSVTATEGHVNAGRLSVLAIHNPTRIKSMPDVPTFAEQGLDPGVMPIYNTFFVPKDTPDAGRRQAARRGEAGDRDALRWWNTRRRTASSSTTARRRTCAQELKRDREVTTALIEAMQKDKPAQ